MSHKISNLVFIYLLWFMREWNLNNRVRFHWVMNKYIFIGQVIIGYNIWYNMVFSCVEHHKQLAGKILHFKVANLQWKKLQISLTNLQIYLHCLCKFSFRDNNYFIWTALYSKKSLQSLWSTFNQIYSSIKIYCRNEALNLKLETCG